MKIWTKR